MQVTLPDGTPLELADGATGADAAAAIGAGPGRAALAVKVDGATAGPRPPAARRRAAGDHHRRARGRTRSSSSATTPPTCSAAAVLELYPGVKISIGPPIEHGFYYDFEFPEGVHVLRRRLRAHRGAGCASTSRPTSRSSREDVPRRRGARALPRRGPGLQGRADRGPGPRPGHRDRLPLHQRPVHRPLPRPARAVDEAHRGVQAAVGRRRLLARRRRPPDAHPRLRHGVPQAKELEAAPASCSSRPARATTASSAASSACSPSREVSPGSAVLAAARHAIFNQLVALSRDR